MSGERVIRIRTGEATLEGGLAVLLVDLLTEEEERVDLRTRHLAPPA